MHLSTPTILWLFPIAFMIHDFEEILFWEVWLNRHREDILRRIPAYLSRRVSGIARKTTAQTALPIGLIFLLTVASTLVAVEADSYHALLLASSVFWVHGFMHLGQALLLRRYVPAVVTSGVIVLPYGALLYGRLLEEKVVTPAGLCIYLLVGVTILIPFILLLHQAGDFLFRRAVRRLSQ